MMEGEQWKEDKGLEGANPRPRIHGGNEIEMSTG